MRRGALQVPSPCAHFLHHHLCPKHRFVLTGHVCALVEPLLLSTGLGITGKTASVPSSCPGQAAKRATGTKGDKQRIICQATIHHLKPKQRNNFPASTAPTRWAEPLHRQAGVPGPRNHPGMAARQLSQVALVFPSTDNQTLCCSHCFY